MISACFISVLCIKMEPENSGMKSEGRDKPLPENTEYSSAVVGNIKQPLLLRDGAEVTLEG